ncbi:MAG: M28 family peptidase [Acidobacteria bacterium]|nr:M28 family peptidase [Acidobacteriota bacterium]
MKIKNGFFIKNAFLCSAVVALAVTLNPFAALVRAQQTTAVKKDASLGKVSAEAIKRHVTFLASDKLQGRRAGTPEADEAAKYIASEFRKAGLKPLTAAGFFQPFTFVSGVKLGAGNNFQLKGVNDSRLLKTGEDYMPLAFSSSQPVQGELLFIGYGISAPELQYDNYAGVDVKGKIVVILRGSPDGNNPHGKFADFTAPGMEIQKKTIKAREKGASGVIFISEETKFSNDRLAKMRHDLNFLDAGIPTVVVSKQIAESLFAAAKTTFANAIKHANESAAPLNFANTVANFKTDVVKINGKSSNVVGVIEGSDAKLKSEYLIIGAHYDHLGLGGSESLAANPEGQIHHGADDNASGTSALLELARVINSDRAKLKRSVVFMAFSAEELGLLGSAAYTKNPLVPLASTVAMLNMDMVGRLHDRSLFVGGVGTSPVWKPLLDKLNGETKSPETGSGSRFQLGIGQDGLGPSDHQSFYIKDVPVLFFFTGSHEDYHKPSDTADKINAEGTRQIAELVRDIAIQVANEPERLAFTKVKTETPNQGRRGGFRVSLGTVPSYAEQSDGLKLDGVRPASPAEKAGLKAGDVIVKLAAFPIKNVYDYTAALSELKANETIDVVIRRDGKELTLKLTPEKRQ